MKNSVYTERLKILRKKLAHSGLDAAWIIQPENRRYLSGFRAADLQLNESSGSLLIKQKKALLITDSRYTLEAREEASNYEVITQKGPLIEELTRQLSRLKIRRLGFEGGYLTWNLYQELSCLFNKLSSPIKLVPLEGMVEEMRRIKDSEEIRFMKKASNLMSRVLNEVLQNLAPGKRENEIAREIEHSALEMGAEGLAFDSIVASGPNAALPHAVPTTRKIRKKEPVVFDVGLKISGYCCDMTRTVFLDNPEPEFREIYRIVREAQLAALEWVKPGVLSTLPDSIARGIIGDAGYGEYFGHSLGHGVGLAAHEAPGLRPSNPVALQEGMVVTVEPGIYLPGKGGVRLEEMVVIEKGGPRILTKNNHFYNF